MQDWAMQDWATPDWQISGDVALCSPVRDSLARNRHVNDGQALRTNHVRLLCLKVTFILAESGKVIYQARIISPTSSTAPVCWRAGDDKMPGAVANSERI